MNKEQIFEKSKKENLLYDEKETQNKRAPFEYSVAFGSLAFIVLFILSITHNIDISSAKVMMYAMITGSYLQHFLSKRLERSKQKNTLMICLLLALTFMTIASIIDMI